MGSDGLNEIERAQDQGDYERAHGLLHELLSEHDPLLQSPKALEEQCKTKEEPSVSPASLERMMARVRATAAELEQRRDGPTLWQCYEAAMRAGADSASIAVGPGVIELLQRDGRVLERMPLDIIEVGKFVRAGDMIIDKVSLRGLFSALKIGYPKLVSPGRFQHQFGAARVKPGDTGN